MKQKTAKKGTSAKAPILSGRQIELLCIVWFCVILFLIIHLSFVYGTGGISKGMSFSQAMNVQGDQFSFNYYSYFKNSEGNYVVVHYVPADKVGSVVNEVVCLDARTVNPTEEQFNKVQPGMDPIEVAKLVGIPFDKAESEYEDGETPEHTYTLYARTDGKVYMMEWEYRNGADGQLDFNRQYLKSCELSGADALEEDIPSTTNIGLWIGTGVDTLLLVGAIVFTLILLLKKKKTA